MASYIFRAPLFVRPQDPKAPAVEYVAAPPLALLEPVPGQPFAEFNFPLPKAPLPRAVGEPYGSPVPLLRTAPFTPLHFHVLNLQRAIPPKIPNITTIAPLSPLFFPMPVRPFNLLDWPNPTLIPRGARVDDFVKMSIPTEAIKYVLRHPLIASVQPAPPPQKSDVYASPVELVTGTPARPFSQSAWDSPARVALSPKSDSYSGELTLYGPQISIGQPTSQDIWDLPARTPLSLKSEVYQSSGPLYRPGQPFNQNLWESATRPLPKATGEPVAGDLPALTASPPTKSFNEDIIWPAAARGPLPQKSDVYDSPDSLTRPPPFAQRLWENAARAAPKSVSDVYDSPDALTRPNPARPLVQSDWFQNRFSRKALVDDVFNPQIDELAVARTIAQYDWPNATLPRVKIGGDFSVPAPQALYNPGSPFRQNEWVLPTRARALPTSSDYWPGAPYTPPPPPPPTGIHARPFFATMGGMTVIQGDS